MELLDYINDFAQKAEKLNEKVRMQLNPVLLDIKTQIINRSPKDTGAFRSRWRMLITNTEAGIDVLYKNVTDYAVPLEEGIRPGAHPWYWFQPKTEGETSRSGKLVYQKRRVWAGGRSPEGHVVDGILKPIMYKKYEKGKENQKNITDAVLNALEKILVE